MSSEITVPESRQSMLVPASLTEAMNLANMMSNAKLVPTHLQGKPADCLLVIEQAQRWNMSPFAVAQCTSVISGKLMYEGKLVAGVINASGALSGRLSYAYHGEGADRSIVVSGTFKNEQAPREIIITLAESKTNNLMWTKQPDQQLMYHGTRVWARRHAPELMLGIYSPEEMLGEIIDVTPQPPAPKLSDPKPIDEEVETLKQFARNIAGQGNEVLDKYLGNKGDYKDASLSVDDIKKRNAKLLSIHAELRQIADEVDGKVTE